MARRRYGSDKGPEVQRELKINGYIYGRVKELMENRQALLAPCPIPADTLYCCMFTLDERMAMDMLMQRHRGIVHLNDQFMITDFPLDLNDGRETRDMIVHLFERRPLIPYGGSKLKFGDIPLEIAKPLLEWGPIWNEYRRQKHLAFTTLERLAEVCTTWGHLFRLWPDVQSLMPQSGAMKVAKAKAKSPYPPDVWMHDADGKAELRPGYDTAHFAMLTEWLSEALMLPMGDRRQVMTY